MKDWDELSESEQQAINDKQWEEENEYGEDGWVPKGTMQKKENDKIQIAERNRINDESDKLTRIENKLDLILKYLGI